jgi:hypothetical protein
VLTPLAVFVGLNEPPVAVQFTDVSTALVTVAFAVAVYPTLRLVALLVIALIVTVLGVTVTELSTKLPAAFVARSQNVLAVVSAAVVMIVPLVGDEEMSLVPCDVPTDADVAPVNVGVRSTVAP